MVARILKRYVWRQIANIMNENVVTLPEDASVKDAAKEMNKHRIGSVVVTEGKGAKKRVKGIVTERDMVRFIETKKDPAKVKLKEIMVKRVVTIPSNEDFMIASHVMEEHKIKKLPVVDNGYLVGIITMTDINRAVSHLGKFYSFRLASMTEHKAAIKPKKKVKSRSKARKK